jgi:hypothetical protein
VKKTLENMPPPRLEQWYFFNGYLVGQIFGDERFDDGTQIMTSSVRWVNVDTGMAETDNSLYSLGKWAVTNDTYYAKFEDV